MKLLHYKLFNNKTNKVEAIKRPLNKDYYEFVREMQHSDFNQIIITSDIMIQIIKVFFTKHNAEIIEIELLEQYKEHNDYINTLIEDLLKDRAKIVELLESLKSFHESSVIDIKKINIKLREDGEIYKFYLYINGILETSSNEITEKYNEIICSIVEREYNG